MQPTSHRGSRALHRYRHGLTHYLQHRRGTTHGHRRSRRHRLDAQRTPRETLRHTRRLLRRDPVELLKQVALGALLAVGIVLLVCVVWGVVTILSARHDLSGAQGEATSLAVDRSQLFTKAGRAKAERQIAEMQKGTAAAASLVDSSIPLHVLSWIPLVGQQVQGVDDLCNDFNTTSNQASTLLASLDQLLATSHGTSINLGALAILNQNVHSAVNVLRPLNRGSGLLIGPLASARDTFDRELTKITSLLSVGGNLLDYAGPFLGADGPRTYFIAGENNSEMRDQGAVLSWALLTARNGTFSMTRAKSVGALSIRHPADVHLPAGTVAAFGVLQPTRVWQSVNATADFQLSGETMAAMYARRTHLHVNGVIAVDADTLQGILRAVGGVYVPGFPAKVVAKHVTYDVLHGIYLLYPKGYQLGRRHDEIAAVAKAAVDKMKHHPYDLAFLVDQLAKSVRDRHLLVWSQYPNLEAAVSRFGASGVLTAHGADVIHLALESAVAAKLDWYVHAAAIFHVSVDQNGTATIEADVTVANTAPRDCKPHYVCGPDHINSSVKGQYVGRLDLWFPDGASTPGGLHESGLTLARLEHGVDVLPHHEAHYVIFAVLNHAVRDGKLSLDFIPQSTLDPQLMKVTFDAPGYSVSGPSSALWVASGSRTYTWQLSR